MDGYETLAAIKADRPCAPARHRHLRLEELDSVVRCIEMGAADYLPKPFNPAILRARISTSLGRQAAPRPGARNTSSVSR